MATSLVGCQSIRRHVTRPVCSFALWSLTAGYIIERHWSLKLGHFRSGTIDSTPFQAGFCRVWPRMDTEASAARTVGRALTLSDRLDGNVQ